QERASLTRLDQRLGVLKAHARGQAPIQLDRDELLERRGVTQPGQAFKRGDVPCRLELGARDHCFLTFGEALECAREAGDRLLVLAVLAHLLLGGLQSLVIHGQRLCPAVADRDLRPCRTMEQRRIKRLGRDVSVIGLGTWQLGADWGAVDPQAARSTLQTGVEQGVSFFDTADVYGDGRSEEFCGALHREHPGVFIATKMGRRVEQRTENYNRAAFMAWNDRSRQKLGMDTLDLVQLHCPPDGVYDNDDAFAALDDMVQEGRIAAYGVSVETCAQALKAIARPGVATVQIILNCFRLKPLDEVLPAAHEAGVGIIARVPLASGLLSGRYDENTTF